MLRPNIHPAYFFNVLNSLTGARRVSASSRQNRVDALAGRLRVRPYGLLDLPHFGHRPGLPRSRPADYPAQIRARPGRYGISSSKYAFTDIYFKHVFCTPGCLSYSSCSDGHLRNRKESAYPCAPKICV